MGMQREDVADHLGMIAANQKALRLVQAKDQQKVAFAMSQLQADPNWAIYGNRLQPFKDRADAVVKQAETILIDPNRFPDQKECAEIKIRLARAKGMSEGIDLALNMAQALIEQGEAAMKVIEEAAKDWP